MEPEEPEKEQPGTGQENALGTGPGGHGIKDEREEDPDGHDPVTLPEGLTGADQDRPGPDALLLKTETKGRTDKKAVMTPAVPEVERKTELQGMSAQPSHEDPARIRRRTERDLRDADFGIPYAKTERAVRDLVCSLIERQDRMNINLFLEINSMEEDIRMLKDQVYKLKNNKTGQAAGAKK